MLIYINIFITYILCSRCAVEAQDSKALYMSADCWCAVPTEKRQSDADVGFKGTKVLFLGVKKKNPAELHSLYLQTTFSSRSKWSWCQKSSPTSTFEVSAAGVKSTSFFSAVILIEPIILSNSAPKARLFMTRQQITRSIKVLRHRRANLHSLFCFFFLKIIVFYSNLKI